ncbi:universal stress protein [uncultured Croceitalea sp.]|uniref:universal stress protein n=1 Tax=uncultured Croceitalea sp. TaxID=1798908 RepID=UPI00330588EC
MKPIVCACDYSDNAATALKMAYALSRKLSARLIVLHVFDINTTLLSPLSISYAKMEKEAYDKHRKKLSAFCETHIGVLPDNIHVKVLVKENPIVHEAIVETTVVVSANILIMGMKGISKLKDLILGSTTKVMLYKSYCPVLAIPETVKGFEFDTLTYATDFEEADIHAIDWLVKTIAKPYNSLLNIIHISIKDEGFDDHQMEWFKEMLELKINYKKTNYKLVLSKTLMKRLVEELEKTDTNMVAMLEREKSPFIRSLTHSDLVKQMLRRRQVPLLSINKKNVTKLWC